MKSKLIKILKLIIPIGIGVYLTWYFLSGLDEKQITQTKNAFFEANYFWIILSLIMAILSHLSRAYRWRFLLEPMGYKPKLSNVFYAVMGGYIINLTIPRSGEVARAGLLTTYEKVPFEKGFATIVIERVIDVLMLGLIVFISGILQTNTEEINQITAQGKSGGMGNLIIYLLIGGLIFGLIGLLFYIKNQKFKSFFNTKIRGFYEGLKSIWTMKKKWAFLFHTLFIWANYVGMIWVAAEAFPETEGMSIACVFGVFVVGAAAMALLPGGIGAYPAWVTAVLALYGINFAGYGIFVWVVQTALIVLVGLLSLFLIQRQPKLIDTKIEEA